MSFLHNRRPSIRARLAGGGASTPDLLAKQPAPQSKAQSSIAFPPAVEYVKKPSSRPSTSSGIENNGVLHPTRIMRRVSTFLSRGNSKKKSLDADVSGESTPSRSSGSLSRKNSKKITPLILDPQHSSKWQVVDELSPTESDDTIDDIRRPSGLGRSVSISSQKSMPPSPFSIIPEESSPFASARNSYVRQRALSSPNFLGSFTQKAGHRTSMRSSMLGTVGHTSLYSAMPSLPADLWITVLAFLPPQEVARIAAVSKDVYSAAKRVLYETIDLRMLQHQQVESLVKLLAYRADLTELVRTFECHAWPEFFPPHGSPKTIQPPSPSFSPMLTATFTIAFQNMHRITSLVLPSFDPTFLRHHSAFGLTKISFLNTSMSESETTRIFTWLDGQINITHLEFPNLVDQEDTPSTPQPKDTQDNSTSPYPSSRNILKDSTNGPTSNNLLLTPTPSTTRFGSSTSLAPSSPFSSPTLLPELSRFVGTPSLLTSLITPKATARPLKKVTLNINKTLYTGLRPSAVISTLQELDLTHLGFKFGPAVDRRTVGKVLSASAALFPSGEDSDDEVYDSKADKQARKAPLALKSLEVILGDFSEGADQALYKVLSTILPRYHGLETIRMGLFDCVSQSDAVSERDATLIQSWTKHCPSLHSIRLLSGAIWEKS